MKRMSVKKDVAAEIAWNLLQINAIKLNVKNPFTWASGLRSPIYCDNRRIWSFPRIRTLVIDNLTGIIQINFPEVELIAGVATGAIAPGVLVADRMQLPFVYVRSEPKSHGLGVHVEGHAPQGLKTLVVEDLVSTGNSSLSAYNTLKENGYDMLGMIAIFSYELDIATKNMELAGCRLLTLSNYQILIQVAGEQQKISPDQMTHLREWRENPQSWSDAIENENKKSPG
jgi:orotate phosphoribosyltransferase